MNHQALDVLDSDGTHSIREVLTIVFYIRKPHSEVGPEIESAIHRFANLVSLDALRYFADSEGEWQDLLEKDLVQRLQEEYGSFAGTPNAGVMLRGKGRNPADFYLRYSGDMRAGEKGFASYLQCWVPAAYGVERQHELERFATDVAESLPFGFGYVSPAVVGDDRRRLQRLARRYLTLDIAYANAVKLDIGDGAAGSYWITYLGQQLTESVGGMEELRRALSDEVKIDEIGNGKCRIRLGPEPIIGDVNYREDASQYRSLAVHFHNCGVLRTPERLVYFKDDGYLGDREAQEQWHRRLLEPHS